MRDKRGLDHNPTVQVVADAQGNRLYRMTCPCGKTSAAWNDNGDAHSAVVDHRQSIQQ
jgi:hypothetical protein